jgi:hypothetical protein
MNDRSKDDSAVQVARITARQAIIVAIISALCGLIGAAATAYFRPEALKPTVQHFLKMPTAIDGLSKGTSVRIVADVNGNGYSYPTDAVWTDIRPNMPTERFGLPPNIKEARIKFRILVRSDGDKITEFGTNTNALPVSEGTNTPFDQRCTGVFFDSGFARGEGVSISYEVQ